eukprot:1160952-Pelagomonas_calceolata.AAC.8
MHAEMPGFKKCERLPNDKQQIWNPTNPHIDNEEGVFVPNLSNPTLMLKVPDWGTWAYTYGSCHIQNGKQKIGAGVYCHHEMISLAATFFIEPNGAGTTNTMCRAELAEIAAAIMHSYSHIASDRLTSLHRT